MPGAASSAIRTTIPSGRKQNHLRPRRPENPLAAAPVGPPTNARCTRNEAAFVNGANIAINGGQHMF
jgi:hypothetical protein